MADIIGSRRTDQTSLINEFKHAVDFINTNWSTSTKSPLTITLGDEFQGVLNDMESCFKLVFDMEEYFVRNSLNIKLRYVMHYGHIDTPINKEVAYGMLGSGLTQAREQLTKLKSSSNRFFVLTTDKDNTASVINDLFFLYESYRDSWKLNDYPIVSEFLENSDYKAVADNLLMNKSSAWRRHKSLYIEEYNTAKSLILTLNNIL